MNTSTVTFRHFYIYADDANGNAVSFEVFNTDSLAQKVAELATEGATDIAVFDNDTPRYWTRGARRPVTR